MGDYTPYIFELKVEQQPERARMCGFGDKDRRPITPPPCVRLIVRDRATRAIVPPDRLNGTFFVMQVDLWDAQGGQEVNLVRHNGPSPAVSISSASTTSFPPTMADRQMPGAYAQMYQHPNGQPMYNATPAYGIPVGQPIGYPPAPGAAYHQQQYYAPNPYGMPQQMQNYGPPPPPPAQYSHSANTFTRNLIGSLTVNSSLLKDLNDEENYWFVLQDLSVRTEGTFCLRLSFFDVGAPDGGLNKSKAPVLANQMTTAFHVYSAKKFPGVVESTDLSKKFAEQGIKIPIRKEGKNGDDGGNDY